MCDLYIDYKEKIGDYKKDGVLYCGNCNKPKQMFNPIINKIVGCYCDCAKQKDLKEKLEYQNLSNNYKYIRNRQECFNNNEKLYTHTFENSDPVKHLEFCRKWAKEFNIKKSNNILMFGDVGTGKTFLSECIANELLKQGFTAFKTNFETLQRKLWDNKTYIDELMEYDLLIIDDLGIENDSKYMSSIVFDTIDARINVNKPMIITTNLEYGFMLSCKDIERHRIYDRLSKNWEKLEFRGNSFRLKSELEQLS